MVKARGLAWALLLAGAATPALGQGAVQIVETPGTASLAVCRSWVFFNSCQDYNHVEVPRLITLGSEIDLVFGSNTKDMIFPITQIARDGTHCTIFMESDPSSPESTTRIEIDSCKPASPW